LNLNGTKKVGPEKRALENNSPRACENKKND